MTATMLASPLILAVFSSQIRSNSLEFSAAPAPLCGNAVVEGDEDCDDGGTCLGSINAGTGCSKEGDCPDGRCVPFGGDGCAANCTGETDVPFYPVPGAIDHAALVAHS